MSLWGVGTVDEAKPKWLTAAEKRDVIATTRGWEKLSTGEVLVAIGSLSETGKLAIASVSSVIPPADGTHGAGDITFTVVYNEGVTITGVPFIEMTRIATGTWFGAATTANLDYDATLTLAANGGIANGNQVVFKYTVVSGDNIDAGFTITDTATINLNGGTIVDTIGGGSDAQRLDVTAALNPDMSAVLLIEP